MSDSTLDQFKARRALWIQCLSGDDRHSIMRQIWRMIWNAAAFRIVNEGRRLSPPAKEGGVQLNGMIHTLLNEGFFEGQMLAIRRLTDSYPITGDSRSRDVFSLTSLLDDMRQHVHLMTRANLFAAEDREYDVDAVRSGHDEYVEQRIRDGDRVWSVPKELDWQDIEERHRQVDLLAGANSDDRRPDDVIRTVVIEHLKRKVMKSSEGLHRHVDKFIAHAATPESRRIVAAPDTGITLSHLYRAHEAVCTVAHFVDLYLLTGNSHTFLPVPQHDHLAYIDRPLVSRESIKALQATWEAFGHETDAWRSWGLEELFNECPV